MKGTKDDTAMMAFDRTYYARYYESRRTRVQGPREVARLAKGVTAIIESNDGKLGSVLDVGAGAGLWRDWFRRHYPRARYVSTDVSAYACEKYGHVQRDITTFRSRSRFDLIICQGVLPYLKSKDAERAIENLGAMSNGYLYLEAVTTYDLENLCDRNLTDGAMLGRSGGWYKKRLEPHFVMMGFGLWIKKDMAYRFYELECGLAGRLR